MSPRTVKKSGPVSRPSIEYAVERFGVCRDTATYFAAARDAILSARRNLTIIGWDIHSQVRLLRGERDVTLLETLEEAVEARPELQVRILVWAGQAYRHQREFFQRWRFERTSNVQFVKDESMPHTACSHLKLLVVDDVLVFAGGVDLAHERWDTVEHRPEDPRRVSPDNVKYEPFHDIQYVVTGEVATQLAALARERWEDVTGETYEPVGDVTPPWPADIEPSMTGVRARLALTRPPWARGPLRAVESSYLEMIEGARRSVYIENQYLTSTIIVDALRHGLTRPEGPEVVVVAPSHCDGWMEQKTIEPLRKEAFERLRAADRFHRLRIVAPVSGESDVFVHAKVCVVDDRYLRVGSANLTDRSMGVDLECDLIIQGRDAATRDAIRRTRDLLMGVHLGMESAAVAARVASCGGSLVRVVDASEGPRRLVPIAIGDVGDIRLPRELVDPAVPGEAQQLFGGEAITSRGVGDPSSVGRRIAVTAVAVLGLWGMWRLLRAAK